MTDIVIEAVTTDQILAITILVIAIIFVLISVAFLFGSINSLYNDTKEMQDRANKSIDIINQTSADVQATEQLIQGFAINSGKTHDALVTACGFNCALAQVTQFFPPSNRVPYSQTCQDLLPNLTCNL